MQLIFSEVKFLFHFHFGSERKGKKIYLKIQKPCQILSEKPAQVKNHWQHFWIISLKKKKKSIHENPRLQSRKLLLQLSLH